MEEQPLTNDIMEMTLFPLFYKPVGTAVKYLDFDTQLRQF